MADKPKMTAEQATALIREVTDREGVLAAEVTALGVCVSVIEGLPGISRGRLVEHLKDMFTGIGRYELLAALADDFAVAAKERDELAFKLKRIGDARVVDS